MGKKVEVSYNPQLGYLQTIFHHNFDFLTGIKSYTERTDGVEFVVDTYKENTVKVFIQCVGETAFRFRMYTPGNEHPFDNSIYQLEGQNGVNITENEEFISISKGKIEARVRKYPWEVSYYLDGKLKTKEQIKDSNVDNMCKNLPVGFTYDENKEIIGVTSTKTDDEKVTLEVAVSGSAQEIAIHQQKFDLYMKEHPNVTIKPVDIGSERFQKLMTLIGADNAPDIIYLNEWTYVMANKGVLLGLNDLIEQEQFDTSVYPESLLTPLRYEGELYALPQEVSPFVIYYNKEMFEAANVPLPTDDWTIDEFYAAAEALTDPAEKVYGYRHPGAWADQVLGWLSRAGVDFDISGKEVKGLDTPEALNALTFLYDLVVKDELSPNPAALTAMGKGADAMFRNQKVAMESAGLWMLPTYKENPLPFEWDVVRMPMDKNQNTKAGILNWGISKSTKNPEAAWDLLKFLCGPEGNRIVAESNMALPGSTDKEALQIVLDSKFPSNVKAFVDSVPDCDLKDQLSIYRTEVNTKVQQLVDEMLIGKSTPEETQEKLIKEINAILAN